MKSTRIKVLKSSVLLGVMLVGAPVMGEHDLFPRIDQQIPHYSSQRGVSGKIKIIGSTTMDPILKKWKDQLEKVQPHLDITLDTEGSNIGFESLMSGKTHIAAMSRPLKNEEIKEFTKRVGYPPTSVPVAVDAFAVFVHKDNPLDQITFQQLDAVFSSERRRGAQESLDHWGQLGLSGTWEHASILAQIRDSNSGTGQFFREFVLLGGKDKETSVIQPGAASVVHAVMNDPYAIGYSGIGYRTDSVKPLRVAGEQGEPFIEPTFETASNGSYPLRRVLYLYVNHPSQAKDSPLLSEVVKFAVSQEGQQVVAQSGFFPLPTKDLVALYATWSKPITSAATNGNPQ
ncbi:MAG: PstS family phosphate ABC transporter substrate-binding protein [Nitrospirales bacterium]|nr:PstS family phosphate ABC transporter substrate-binding protein [Nitrospirales bacterium]